MTYRSAIDRLMKSTGYDSLNGFHSVLGVSYRQLRRWHRGAIPNIMGRMALLRYAEKNAECGESVTEWLRLQLPKQLR